MDKGRRRPHANTVKAVCNSLQRNYGRSRLGNPKDPVDDLIFVSLSNKTSPLTAKNVFSALKARFPTWSELLEADIAEIQALLLPSGLWIKRSTYLVGALKRIRADFGEIKLDSLRDRPQTEVLEYLTSLPGISVKVARCVMMYTLGFEVLPVDSHVHRVAARLGWTAKTRPDQSHDELEAIIPPSCRYVFHVAGILHGRRICTARDPECPNCCIKQFCKYYMQSKGG